METKPPPAMPTASEMMVRKKSMTMVARMRGVTSFLSGSVPRARMASICSVTCMEPSSLAMPEALRPETMRPVSTGPSSLIMERLTNSPVTACGAELGEGGGGVQSEHAAGEKAGKDDDGQGADADEIGLR